MNQVDKILTLLEKGYTKAEIDTMLATSAPADPAPAADPEPQPVEPAAEPEPEPSAPAAPETLPGELSGFMTELKQSLSELTAAVQANNIRTASIDTRNVAEAQDKILASFINPPDRVK